MSEKTLIDLVMDFSTVEIKRASIKVPKLKNEKNAKKTAKQFFLQKVKEDKIPTSHLINILIKNAIDEVKKNRNTKKTVVERERASVLARNSLPFFSSGEEDNDYNKLKEERPLVIHGGYGTISRGYGTAPHTSYVDYGKLFSYLGKFKAQSPYENMAEHLGAFNKSTEGGSFTLADREIMDKGARHIRYFATGQDINVTSLAPIAVMSSAEWEQFKLWMKLDPVMYRLKTSIS